MQNHRYRTLLILAVVVVSAILIYPTIGWMTLSESARQDRLEQWNEEDRSETESGPWHNFKKDIRRWAQFDRARVINLGLDLQGGIHMVLGFELSDEAKERGLDEKMVQDMILQRVWNRINEFEAKEPSVQKLGNNQIQIQLPGEKDIQRAKNLIMRMAELKFHMVSGPDETIQVLSAVDRHFGNGFVPFLERPEFRGGPFQVKQENFERIRELTQELLSEPDVLPEDKAFFFSTPPRAGETQLYSMYLADRKEQMTGEGMKSAIPRPDNDSPGYWQILFTFDSESANRFSEVTGENINRQMAIVLDGNVVSAPTINQRIHANGQITGSFSADEAQDLAIALNSGSMPVPIREDYTGVVGATLGQDSVNKGVRSSVVGFIIVMLFMAFYYRLGGLVANVSLVINGLIVLGALAYFNATLTLPGIAGLILTIGMAVDANVLIYERIREELRNGKSLPSAIEGGYARATITILDANITTLIAAAVLTQFGTGPVQGFAVTLSIGVCASVFAALIVTRAILEFLSDNKIVTNLAMMSILKGEPKFKFLAKRKLAAIVSAVAIAVGVVVFGMRGSENFGVDFTDGTNMIVDLNASQRIEVGRIRERLADAGFDSPSVQEYREDLKDNGSSAPDGQEPAGVHNQFVIRVSEVAEIQAQTDVVANASETISSRIQKALLPLCDHPTAMENLNEEVELLKVETVGPAVGRQLRRDAIAAITYALIFIVMYLWFRFELKFAIAAVVALIHDVLVVVGIFAMTGREITIPLVAALLTIIGYSLNDTIVVFDRVREDLRLYRGRGLSYLEIMDISINQTLSRTLLTSLTTLFVVAVLYVFGGVAINDFAFALMIGVLVGTYSSIFVASPVVYLWQQFVSRRVGPSGTGTTGGEKGRQRTRKRAKKSKSLEPTEDSA